MQLRDKVGVLCTGSLVASTFAAVVVAQPAVSSVEVPLLVNTGVPLRVYVTKRLHMRKNEPVRAKLIDPVYAFDRVVVPAGVELEGHVTRLDPVSRMVRAQAMLNGDFTPLHFARVEFNAIVMPDGHRLAIHTADSEGLRTIYSPSRPAKHNKGRKHKQKDGNGGVIDTARQQAQEQIQQQVSARTRGVIDLVRGPNKKERLEDFLVARLPYRPQWYRRNTRFDAVLTAPLGFGITNVPNDDLKNVGLPTGEAWGHVRLLEDLSSADASTSSTVNGVLAQPVFSMDHKLILPEGTHLSGRIRQAKPARWFHRGGQLRFTFDRVDLPALLASRIISTERSPIMLAAAETDPRANVKIGPEGEAKATEPKSRLLAPMLALIVASRAADNDAGRTTGSAGGTANYGGRSLGGFSGLGWVGTGIAQSSKTVGAAFGYYGLAWTVYSTMVSRGREVEFKKNTAVDVRFGTGIGVPAQKQSSHFLASNR